MALENDLILRAARGEEVERTPVWLMRQAGRILPEYRELRASVSGFKELVKTPDLASEASIQPIDHLGVDACIVFSDILTVPEAMGLNYEMIEKKGPYFPKRIDNEADRNRLNKEGTRERLDYVMQAIQHTVKKLHGRVPLIGFAGAPWTIFCYMVEGSGSKTFSRARKMIAQNPDLARALLNDITDCTLEYLKAQVEAGADMLQLFDSWAGILSEEWYREFAIPGITRICNEINDVPITVFAKGAHFALEDLAELNCETVGLDWTMDPGRSRTLLKGKTLQGNLDPAILYGDEDQIRKETVKMLRSFGHQKHIANLGHGVYPDTDPKKVSIFIDTVKAHKSVYHEE